MSKTPPVSETANQEELKWLGKPITERRTRILYAAQEVFATEGFRRAEVKVIAEKAGVGKATIYKFFENKEKLLLVIVEENLNHLRDLALKSLVASKDPILRLEDAAQTMAEFVQQHSAFSKVLIQEAGDFMGGTQKEILASFIEQHLPFADAFFSTLRQDGHFIALPTKEAFELLLDVFFGTIYTWSITGAKGDLPTKAIKYVRVLIEGLKSTPDTINKGFP